MESGSVPVLPEKLNWGITVCLPVIKDCNFCFYQKMTLMQNKRKNLIAIIMAEIAINVGLPIVL